MALTIAWEGKGVIANCDGLSDSAGGTWSEVGGGSIEYGTDAYLTGSGCIAGAYSNKTGYQLYSLSAALDFDVAGTEEGQFIYVWLQTSTIYLHETIANGGLTINVGTGSGSNFRTYMVAAGDDTNGWTGDWKCFIIDPSLPGTVADTGTYDLGNVNYIWFDLDITALAKGNNFLIDMMAVGKGLRVTGTSTTPWDDIVTYCTDYSNRAWGCVQEREGIYYVYGKVWFGDDGGVSAAQSFQESAAPIVQFGSSEYYYNSEWVLSVPEDYAGIVIEDDSSYTTTFDDGVIVGSDGGRSGTTYLGQDDLLASMDLYGGSNTGSLTRLYGTQFRNLRGGINMGNDAQHLFYGGSVTGCGQFDPVGAPIIRNVSFISTKAFDTTVNKAWMEDNGTSFTDETTDINDSGTADVALLPATMATNDAFYFGSRNKFDKITIFISTATDATTVLVWEYYNGSSWATLTVTDSTAGFENVDLGTVKFTIPGAWARTYVNNETALFYYVRARVTTAGSTQPVADWAYLTGPPSHAALLWNTNANIQKCNLLANTDDENSPGGIELPDASASLGLTDMTFSGNDVDVINTDEATNISIYDWTNYYATGQLNATNTKVGQTFTTPASTGLLTRARFYLNKFGSPTGNVYAELFATSGGAPTGAALATSNAVPTSDITTSIQVIDFEFEDEYTMAASTTYAIVLAYANGDASNYIIFGYDSLSPTHSGTAYLYTGSWASQSYDLIHYCHRDAFIQVDATRSDPSTAEERNWSNGATYALSGATKIVNSVNLTITVKDQAGVAVQNAQTSIYTDDSNRTELMNEDTTALGVAQASYNYAGDQDIEVRVRKASPGDTQYVNFSALGKIESGGYSLLVTLKEDPNNAN